MTFAAGPWVGALMDSMPRVVAFNTLCIVQVSNVSVVNLDRFIIERYSESYHIVSDPVVDVCQHPSNAVRILSRLHLVSLIFVHQHNCCSDMFFLYV